MIIFENMDMFIKRGDFVTISGKLGKTTLVNILLGKIKYEGTVSITSDKVSASGEITSRTFTFNTVEEELINKLKSYDFNKKEIDIRIKEISKLLEIEKLLEYTPKYLSGGEKQLVLLARALCIKPRILILDDAFSMMDSILKEKLLKLIKKINREEKITVLNFTKDLEESLYSKRIILIDKKVLLNESLKNAYKDEKIYKKLGLELPFMVSLSNKLHYYQLIDDIILDMDKMVNCLWK